MSKIKWIGGFLGLLSGGPLGALAGFALGSIVDRIADGSATRTASVSDSAAGTRNGFLFSLMVLSADVIQADGRIMHSEMETMRRFLNQNFGQQAAEEGDSIIRKLFEKRKIEGDAWWRSQINDCCRQIAGVMTLEQRLQLVAYLVSLAKADGRVDQSEITVIKSDAMAMGLSDTDVDQMLGLGGSSLDDAYKVLGVSPDATDDEVRKAYKQMALKHHPDRVQALGEDVRLAAEKKFQEINEAKERIYKARGM
ncbi:MAG: molecular chaperone DjiA [Bacteroidetes bacterium]|nr:molecular chaperone DjiA [Candidatus Colenecus caballi]